LISKTPTKGPPRRRYPRAPVKVKTRLWSGNDRSQYFEATLETGNISVGGIFFESTFFLKLGSQVHVEFSMPPHHRRVHARGPVVRVEKFDAAGKSRSGFAVKFDEYFDSSEVILANYFLAPVLREFIQGYGRRHKMKISSGDEDQLVDVLAAWELDKARGETSLLTDME
jgi:hypothetical protein